MILKKHAQGPITLIVENINKKLTIRTTDDTPTPAQMYIEVDTEGRTLGEVLAQGQRYWDRCLARAAEMTEPGRCNAWVTAPEGV